MFTLFFTVSNLISISLKFHPIGSSPFFNRLSMATGSRGDVFVVRTSKPIENLSISAYGIKHGPFLTRHFVQQEKYFLSRTRIVYL